MKTIILFCLSTVDNSACTYDTAVRHIRGPDAMVEQCAMSGETILAAQPHPIFGRQYAKILCERREATR